MLSPKDPVFNEKRDGLSKRAKRDSVAARQASLRWNHFSRFPLTIENSLPQSGGKCSVSALTKKRQA